MPLFSDHAYTSITIKINQLSDPNQNDEIDDSVELYISDLIDLIKIQPNSGATEAARAVRKKIKYGDTKYVQLRALQILELLVLNGGLSIGPVIARDDKLLDVLKGIISGHGKTGDGVGYDRRVQKRVINMAIGWKTELQDLDGYKYMQGLYKTIPKLKKGSAHSRCARDHDFDDEGFDDEELSDPYGDQDNYNGSRLREESSSPRDSPPNRRSPPPRPKSKSPYVNKKDDKTDKKKKKKKKKGVVYADEEFEIPQINYKIEAPKIRELIASCYTHTTTLNNLLLQLPADESPLDNDKTLEEFAKCKKIRRKVLNYLQYVGAGIASEKTSEVAQLDEEFLGSLIGANEQLVEVFKKFDFKAGYTKENPAPNYDEESDSDESYYTSDTDEEEEEEEPEEKISQRLQETRLSQKSPPPPRPSKPATLQQAAPRPRPKLDKMETSESIDGDPFGDRNAVANNHSVYD
ncbi:LAS seventeen-binding protein 5 [Candida viswanathii]|uniref:LAS seventeen-binding protein 5 n=1 Tax=Candida viswanathii TaxID=5486 RepID=A0A367XNZ3_9ASCO|nr:LAS seventeen-binding protein 5 [Candida viswanathii]